MRKLVLLAFLVILLGAAGFGSYWHLAGPEDTCLRCHEIRPAHDMWARSPHRDIKCDACHGNAISNGLHSAWENSRRLVSHYSEERHDNLRLTEEQVIETMNRCKALGSPNNSLGTSSVVLY